MLKKTDIAILRILEFDSILEKVLELTVSKVGSECIESLSLFTDNHLLKNESSVYANIKSVGFVSKTHKHEGQHS